VEVKARREDAGRKGDGKWASEPAASQESSAQSGGRCWGVSGGELTPFGVSGEFPP